jgi:hypothetical protein
MIQKTLIQSNKYLDVNHNKGDRKLNQLKKLAAINTSMGRTTATAFPKMHDQRLLKVQDEIEKLRNVYTKQSF